MEMDKKIAVLIPCYNEEMTIGKVIDDFHRVCPDADVYVYNNNSTDATAAIAAAKGAIVREEYRQGKGNVIRSMFRDIDADCYIMVDGDDTYPAEDAWQAAQMVLEGRADMCIGDRLSSTYFVENKRVFHNMGNRMVRFLINWIFHSDIHDIMTGCRAFSPLFVKSYPVISSGFEIETEMTIHALDKNMVIQEIPIRYRDRPDGSESKLNTYSDGIRVICTILSLFKNYRPFQFFSLLSLIILILALILFLPIFADFLQTGEVLRFPTLFVVVGMVIMATFSFFTGLILNTVKRYERQFFELNCNTIKSRQENR